MGGWVYGSEAIAIASIATFFSLIISGGSIYCHLKHYTHPNQQRYIIRILFMCPLYSLSSCLSLRFYENAVIFETLRDIYEAFIIYSFLVLILEYAGGESACVSKMEGLSLLRPPFPCCCLAAQPRNGRLLRKCKQGTLQFVVVKPLVGAISLIMLSINCYYNDAYQSCMLTVYNISYTVALFYLLFFYLATKEVVYKHSPVLKFAAVKCVVFATYYQSLLIRIGNDMTVEQEMLWGDFILCMEMVLFSAMLWAAFPHADYTGLPTNPRNLLQNARNVITVKDVVQDAYHNFMPAYQDYVLQREDTAGHQFPEKIRMRTYLVGNIHLPGRRRSSSLLGKQMAHAGQDEGAQGNDESGIGMRDKSTRGAEEGETVERESHFTDDDDDEEMVVVV